MVRRFCLLFILCLFFWSPHAGSQAQQDTLRVMFKEGSRQVGKVPLLRFGDGRFVSANSLVPLLDLPIIEQTSEAFTFTVPHGTIRLLGGNPFLTVADSARVQTAYQLSSSVFIRREQFYVPLEQFVALLSAQLSIPLTIDPDGTTLHVGPEAPEVVIPLVSSLTMETKANGMLIRMPLSPTLKNVEHWITEAGWLYVSVAGGKGNISALNATKPAGFIKKIEATQFEGSLQVAFRLNDRSVTEEVSRDPANGDLIVMLRKEEEESSLNLDLSNKRDRWALDVIVIDPGHGGRDPGAIGVTGVKEKDVTLGIALKLGALIKRQMKNVKVVYTRTTDTFVELDKRGTIANEAGGKLFISIHCNSMRRKPNPTRGFEVYLLRPGKTDDAVAIAERENAVIKLEEGYQEKYKHLTDENFILVTMAQSAHVKSSEDFANIVQQELEAHAGIPNGGVKQAGFYVLVGASMPNILVETAYLSNRQDEQFLRSERGQQKIAEAIAAAVKKYNKEYSRLLEEGNVDR
jgi:N-acetylmuramoyl-L-alanine amidase